MSGGTLDLTQAIRLETCSAHPISRGRKSLTLRLTGMIAARAEWRVQPGRVAVATGHHRLISAHILCDSKGNPALRS